MFTSKSYQAATKALSILEYVSRRHGFDQVFSDWITMMVCAFAAGSAEDKFNSVNDRYTVEERKPFAEATGHVIQAYDQILQKSDWADILGNCQELMTHRKHKSAFGEFFTPAHLCDLSAELSMGDIKEHHGLKLSDPACGSGRMLLAGAFACKDPRQVLLHGIDTQERVCQMSAVNLLMHNLEGLIVWGNALTLNARGGFYVHKGPVPWIQHLSEEDLPRMECWYHSQAKRWKRWQESDSDTQEEEIVPIEITKPQLSLFD